MFINKQAGGIVTKQILVSRGMSCKDFCEYWADETRHFLGVNRGQQKRSHFGHSGITPINTIWSWPYKSGPVRIR